MLNFPAHIYDIDKNPLQRLIYIRKNSFYFYSFQNIGVNIVEGIGELYSVNLIDNNGNPYLETNVGQQFNDNFGYTIFIPENKTHVKVEISSSTEVLEYVFILELDNIISEENEHYLDLITNYRLPTYEELEPALLQEFDNSELVKRMLLDFREIIRNKGTKTSIYKFLQFIGYEKDNLAIYDEYYNRKKDSTTLTPNKKTDIKTGNYHVLFDNFETEGLDDNNLPLRYLIVQDLDDFIDSLKYAIALANEYFILEEQDINFFGLCYSSNIALEPSITSHMNQIHNNMIFDFRKDLHIDLWIHRTSENIDYLVKDCCQKTDKIFRSESKAFINAGIGSINLFDKMFFVDEEIFDDLPYDGLEPENLLVTFGSICHIKIESPDTYVEFTLIDKLNPFNTLTLDKQYVLQDVYVLMNITNVSDYNLVVNAYDHYNNREQYFYDFGMSTDVSRIDFESFNSKIISDEFKFLNNINIDTDSSSRVTDTTGNYILPLDEIPEDLAFFYDIQSINKQFLSANNRFLIDDINGNFIFNDITDTIPTILENQWIDVVGFEYNPNYTLKIRIYDTSNDTRTIVDFNEIGDYDPTFDTIYVGLFDIFDRDENDELELTKTPYYFLTTTEVGIDIIEKTYDFILVNNIDSEDIVSIYDTNQITLFQKKIPCNYDFPLFLIESELVPLFVGYISPTPYTEIIEGIEFPIIRSVFPRLVNVSDASNNDTFFMSLGDIFECRLNKNYISKEHNVTWQVYDAFTNMLLFETTDYTLKYRVSYKTIYNISVSFVIDGQQYNIFKKSVFSSFEVLDLPI